MLVRTVNMPHRIVINSRFTRRQNTGRIDAIEISYATLAGQLGPPLPGDGQNTDAEWVLHDEVTGEVAVIYNWRNGPICKGQPVGAIALWTIAGTSVRALDLVRRVLGEQT